MGASVISWLLTSMLFPLASAYTESCHPSFEFLGYTHPHGDIYVEHGQPLEINCTVNNPHQYSFTPSDHLAFYHGNKKVESKYIERINSSTIRLFIPNVQMQNYRYDCKMHDMSVCINKVIVTTKPSSVKDFMCESENWDNLTCIWTKEKNFATVEYKLLYTLPPLKSMKFMCSVQSIFIDNVEKNYCFWSLKTDPMYRASRVEYNFTLNATNYFGSTITHHRLMHFKHIRPNKPTYVNYTSVGTNYVHLTWGVPQTMVAFPEKLEHRVSHTCEFDYQRWKADYVFSYEQPEVHFNLTGLENAFEHCDVRVQTRVIEASDKFWSQNSSVIFRTLGTIPAKAPETTLGTFELQDNSPNMNYREIIVYWQQIPLRYQNGKDFKYNIAIVGEKEGTERMTESNSVYAKFVNMHKNLEYKFELYTSNANGTSVNRSYVTVARDGDRPKAPIVFSKVDYPGGVYELSWNGTGEINNFTIFMCSHDRDRPFRCEGNLTWKVVPSNISLYNMTTGNTKITQFAVAANGPRGSSGMTWMPCTILHDQLTGKLHNVYVNKVNARSIELRWAILCQDGIGRYDGFIVFYCTTQGLKKLCEGPQQNVTVPGMNANHAVIDNLKPYTTYMMTISAISKKTIGMQSDALYNTTLEDAPNPIEYINATVDVHSINITWHTPNTTNGIIKGYMLNLKGPNIISNEFNYPVYNNRTHFSYKFEGLEGYIEYTVLIRACTTSCSSTIQKKIRTRIGRPSKMTVPNVRMEDNDYTLHWDRPAQMNGPFSYYHIQINTTAQQINKNIPNEEPITLNEYCTSDLPTLYIRICAVVTSDNTDRGVGEWSEWWYFNCRQSSPILKWIWILTTLIFVIILAIGIQRCYLRCKQMTDVQVKLPAGLQLPQVKDGFAPWNGPSSPEDQQRKAPSADEEHLLEKLNDGRLSGDSSGCSSGHDSVSSLESGNAPSSSSSDSGTEQPSSLDESNFLRHRKGNPVTVSKPYVTVDAVSSWKPSTAVLPTAGNYCVLGVNPISSPEPETSTYVPTAQVMPAPSKGYVSCPVGPNGQPWGTKSPPTAGNYCVLGLNPEATAPEGYVSTDAFTTK